MEGKQEDNRASPLDFPSAARNDERRRRLDERLAGQAISPPTIPRSTFYPDSRSIFGMGWQQPNSRSSDIGFGASDSATISSFTSAGPLGAIGASDHSSRQHHGISPSRSGTGNYPSGVGSSRVFEGNAIATREQNNTSSDGGGSSFFARPTPTSAFSSSSRSRGSLPGSVSRAQHQGQQIYGQIPAYASQPQGSGGQAFQQGGRRDGPQNFAPRGGYDDVTNSRSDTVLGEGRTPFSSGSTPSSQGSRFFTPLPASISSAQANYPTAGNSFVSIEEGNFYSASSSPASRREFRPHSAASIQTMGSIDEAAISSPSSISGTASGRNMLICQPVSSAGRSGSRERSNSTTRRGMSSTSRTPYRRAGPSSTRAGRSESRSLSSGRSRTSRRERNSISPAMLMAAPTTCTPTPGRNEENLTDDKRNKKSPPPQNLRGDPFRSAKVKTELCRNFNSAKGCPFGDKCNYAHGENELKFTRLMDLERAGLVDIEIFRTHPCSSWVATGSCPFDQRCLGLHDPRIKGKEAAWLPHAETMINKIADGANVDNFYHERVASVYNLCPVYGYVPLIPTTLYEENIGFKHFYDFICNADRNQGRPRSAPRDALDSLSEEAQMQIVLKMRQEKVGSSYTYMPTHLLQGELCMVLQTKRFESRKNIMNGADIVQEIDFDSQQLTENRTIKVHEIAFGPVGDVTVRTVTLWFDIADKDLVECTPQQAKHHKRSRHRLNKKVKNKANIDENITKILPFNHYQPRDHDAFDLITNILTFRLKTVTLLRRGNYEAGVKGQLIHELETEMESLKFRYSNLLRHWITWSWPDQVLQPVIDDETDVPPVDGEYYCRLNGVGHKLRGGTFADESHGLGAKRSKVELPTMARCVPALLWKSFIQNAQVMENKSVKTIQGNTMMDSDGVYFSLRRLPALRHLSLGRGINKNRNLPHLQKTSPPYLSSVDIGEVLNKWEPTRKHYKDNIDSITKRRSKMDRTDQNEQSQDKESIKKDTSRHLEACAAQVKRTF